MWVREGDLSSKIAQQPSPTGRGWGLEKVHEEHEQSAERYHRRRDGLR